MFLLLQNRVFDDPMLEHERQAIMKCSNSAPKDWSFHNLDDQPITLKDTAPYAVVLVGGSGAHSVSQRDQPYLHKHIELVKDLVEAKKPFLGICYGFHLFAAALGANVIQNRSRKEIGTYRVALTDAGKTDPIFSTFPNNFYVQQGHQDHVASVPQNSSWLAQSTRSEIQALKYKHGPAWGVQFHPELTSQTNQDRFQYYVLRNREAQEISSGIEFRPSPEAEGLIASFFEKVAT